MTDTAVSTGRRSQETKKTNKKKRKKNTIPNPNEHNLCYFHEFFFPPFPFPLAADWHRPTDMQQINKWFLK
jgi:hypothetical protein